MEQLLVGTTGADTNEVLTTGTVVFGGAGDDQFTGKTSGNRYYGGSGMDTITAESGDRVFAGAGDDVIYSTGSGDRLIGGTGDDQFWFEDGASNAKIFDFNKNNPETEADKIGIDFPGVASLADLVLDTTTSTGDTLVKLQNGTVIATVKGVTDLTADDFVIPLKEDNAGGDFPFAVNLGNATNTTKTQVGSFSQTDISDMYKFNVDALSDVTVDLTGLAASSNGDILLIQDTNGSGKWELDQDTVLAASQNETKGADEKITAPSLAKGDYYVLVQGIAGVSNYNLSVTAKDTPLVEDNAGGDFPFAVNLGNATNTTKTQPGSFSQTDISDMYKFNVDALSDVTVDLKGLVASSNGDILLIQDTNGSGKWELDKDTVLAASQNETKGADEKITVSSLAKGDYYVLVQGIAGVSNYSLSVTAKDTPLVEDNAGGDFPFAVNLGNATNTTKTQPGSFSQTDISDIYKFNLTTSSAVTIDLMGLTASSNGDILLIQDTDGSGKWELDQDTVLAASQNETKGANEKITSSVLAIGDYYVLVQGIAGVSNYTLTIAKV